MSDGSPRRRTFFATFPATSRGAILLSLVSRIFIYLLRATKTKNQFSEPNYSRTYSLNAIPACEKLYYLVHQDHLTLPSCSDTRAYSNVLVPHLSLLMLSFQTSALFRNKYFAKFHYIQTCQLPYVFEIYIVFSWLALQHSFPYHPDFPCDFDVHSHSAV